MANNLLQDGNAPQRANVNIKLSDLTDIGCDECGSYYFRPIALIKRLSPLVSPSGTEQLVPVQIYRCDDCGHVNENLIPK